MTELQEMLLGYVSAKTAAIIAAKETGGKRPLGASEDELMEGIRDDVRECMRELHRVRFYRGSKTINKAMLLKIEED